eukprot:scaffold110634_cov36-Cyclotella_meneghiniana.AAC.1
METSVAFVSGSHYTTNDLCSEGSAGGFNAFYNERLGKVEIGKWALKWSPQRIFQPPVGSKLALEHTHFSYPD